jgi:pSer/pThr/pTyr-binding forkhead associated (FHA) protein
VITAVFVLWKSVAMAVLIILTGKHQGKRLTVPDGEVVIGRDETCQVRLATNEVSRFHCRVRSVGQRVTVSDMWSRNGTLVNDVIINGEMELKPDDILRVGPVSFQLVGKKVEPPAPEKKNPSDDSILDWLSDEEESQTGDTTIIPRTAAPARNPEPSIAVAEPDTSPDTPPQKKFKTVGEEGEDIIQRHFELVQNGKLPKRILALKPR